MRHHSLFPFVPASIPCHHHDKIKIMALTIAPLLRYSQEELPHSADRP
ncbi:hypothetical protein [Limnofasciculus baicalensis]|uniref:Uncharacterized protein n=1 Tax=Limnofasciculus baicalensis BBK-W-15 TaxID=2699891 RepID=A0AAE3GRH1_9CYAN|nr:hypothetical protein [Limnofasciculus baicalensis]MCP2729199.1 hypothetical protein [Limnofasciculus baicalensis BBK-W-15]